MEPDSCVVDAPTVQPADHTTVCRRGNAPRNKRAYVAFLDAKGLGALLSRSEPLPPL
jgi:hypothetical protein